MKICILYHPNSEQARGVEDYTRDFNRRSSKSIELISLETRDGASVASLYDIVRYPAVLVMQSNGQLVKEWQGTPLPLIDEVAAYLV